MKKFITVVLALIFTFSNISVIAQDKLKEENKTYYYLLTKNNYNLKFIDNRYVTYDKLTLMLDILFNKKIEYSDKSIGNVKGKDLFNILHNDLKLKERYIDEKEVKEGRVLTFASLFEILDYYFYDIVNANNLKTLYGTVSDNGYDHILTYGEGNTKYLTDFPELSQEYLDVMVVEDEGNIVEIIPVNRDIKINMLYEKEEITANLFFDSETTLILKEDEKLVKLYKSENFEILRKTDEDITDKKITVFYGNYKKNKIAVLGLERVE